MSQKLKTNKVRIIGAGFSGLTVAYYLVKRGYQVEIYEKENQVGGLIDTIQRPSMKVETAANAFLWTQDLQDLCDDIGCKIFPALPMAKKRYIFWERPTRWPFNFIETMRFAFLVFNFLFFKAKLRPRLNESISAWGQRVFGKSLVTKILAPALQGIYAGATDRMSASLILDFVFKSKSAPKAKKGSHSPEHGMREFIQKLETYLRDQGVKFYVGHSAELLSDKEIVQIVATKPNEMIKILKTEYPSVDKIFENLEMLDLTRVTVSYKDPKKTIQGFGILFCEQQGFRVLGVLSNTESFANRGSHYNESWIFGGARDSEFSRLLDRQIQDIIIAERKKLLSVEDEIVDIVVVRWSPGLVHYDLNLEKSLTQFRSGLRDQLKQKNIYLTGNFLGAIGLSRILRFNKELALEISEQ